MKTLKEQISSTLYTKKVIGDKDLFEVLEGCGYKDYALSSIIDKCISNIESLIKENYAEKEFVKWIIIEFRAGRITYYDSDNTYSIWNIDIDYTLDELYDYWNTNIKSKQEIK